ncbi:MAG: hypothetical protein OXU20_18360 [Myxococcales bacterium]|nr:hypothetical protein [Myxococcales bacterium]
MRKFKFAVLAAVLVVLCGRGGARAEGVELLQRVRLGVASYELTEGGVVSIIAELTDFLERASDEDQNLVREVAFLRAAASADLLFIAAYTGDDGLRSRLAEAWHYPESLRADVLAALRQADGIYQPPARRIERAMALIASDGELAEDGIGGVSGSWRDIMRLRQGAMALDSAAGPEQVLSTLGKDPCAGIEGGCDELFMTFDGHSRAALAGLQGLGKAMGRLRAAREQGDPLVGALAEDLERNYARIARVELRLRPMLRPGAHVEAEGDKLGRVPVDLLVLLYEDSLQYGYVPRVSLDQDGKLATHASAVPSLPKTKSVRYPAEFRPFMRPISVVVDALRSDDVDPSTMAVGVTVAPGVPSHILGRALLSLRRAGFDKPAIIGPGQRGGPQGVPLRVMAASEVEALRPQPQVLLRVRLGGYSLRMGFGLMDIPRIRGDKGFSFDTAALEDRVSRRKIRSAAVSFMGNVAVENLLAAVWRVAPEGNSLNFVVQ